MTGVTLALAWGVIGLIYLTTRWVMEGFRSEH
jgi:hypothetical protein